MGGFLWIINATSKTLRLEDDNEKYQMTKWEFSDVCSQDSKRFYIEYQIAPVHYSDDVGKANFRLEGTNSSFQLQARWPHNEGECGLKVDWHVDTDSYEVFPPDDPHETFSELGWINNGSLALLILEKGVTTTVRTYRPSDESIVSPLTFKSVVPECSLWMEKYKHSLEKLTLTEMTLPGTHNSGTYRPVTKIEAILVKTQGLSLLRQLQNGIRVLDLRIGQKSPGDYIICHDKYRTSYSLAKALREVKDFINHSKKEIVVLDFHRFVKLEGGHYDYDQLQHQISSALSEYCVPPSCAGETLGDIWRQGSPKQRIVVAWNEKNNYPRDKSYMWRGVKQRWYEDADSPDKLYECIMRDTRNSEALSNSAKPRMWAECSFMKFDLFSNPLNPYASAMHINPTITNWYFGGSECCEKANIISVDYFDEHSNVVQAAIIGSLIKAGRKY